jgi:molybdenum cofactor cytidylyltransferase
MILGIVLAGGASSRMGQPKALLPLGGITMAERLLALFEPFCDRTVLVTGAHHSEISAALPHLAGQIVFNEGHSDGMFSSLRKGLSQQPDADAVLFSPVDYAAIAAESIACLFRASPTAIVKPRWQGHSGHPVLIRKPAIAALLAADPTANAKAILSTLPATYIDTDDSAVAQDCDTPADYEKILSSWRQSA